MADGGEFTQGSKSTAECLQILANVPGADLVEMALDYNLPREGYVIAARIVPGWRLLADAKQYWIVPDFQPQGARDMRDYGEASSIYLEMRHQAIHSSGYETAAYRDKYGSSKTYSPLAWKLSLGKFSQTETIDHPDGSTTAYQATSATSMRGQTSGYMDSSITPEIIARILQDTESLRSFDNGEVEFECNWVVATLPDMRAVLAAVGQASGMDEQAAGEYADKVVSSFAPAPAIDDTKA